MRTNQNYELTKLRNARFPSFFFITMENENGTRRELISTSQHSEAQTLFTGQKPDDVPEFMHAKACLITVTDFSPQLSREEREKIAGDKSEQVTVGTLNVSNVGNFQLIFDNKNQKIYLNGTE